jgi:CheY-like chemotaxis protein
MSKISPITIANSANVRTSHSRVLVVEDDVCLQNILIRLLKNIEPSVEICWVASADEAWSEIQNKSRSSIEGSPYDLFISDISTPGVKSGIDFWKTCQMTYPNIPFLFTSGISEDEFFKSFGNSVVCPPFLAKPFAVGECRQIMKILLESGKTTPNEFTQNSNISAVKRESS